MGFSNSLKSNVVNEWKDYYLDYDRLRSKIKHRDFKPSLYNEMAKVNNFYFLLEKKAVDEKNKIFEEAFKQEIEIEKARTETTDTELIQKPKRTRNSLLEQTDDEDACLSKKNYTISNETSTTDFDMNSSFNLSDKFVDFMNIKKGFRKRKKEKHITEFLNSLVKIKSYRDLNSTGFIKLAKKYSEVHKNPKFYEKFTKKLEENYFYKSKRIGSIKNATKKIYKQLFAKNEPGKAKTVFKRLGKDSKSIDIYYIAAGLLMGTTIPLGLRMDKEAFAGKNAYLLFHAISNFFWGIILFGLALKIFKNFAINYKFIFNFDVVSSMNNSKYVLLISSLLFLNTILFTSLPNIASILSINQYVAEDLACYFAIILPAFIFLCPLNIFFRNSRIYLMAVLARAIFLPISSIRFRHFYFIDFLQSFKFSIVNITNYLMSNNWGSFLIFCIFPVVRILQCLKRFSSSKLVFPHILNAFKYFLVLLSLSMDKIYLSNKNQPNIKLTAIILKVISAVSSFLWDVVIDWAIIRNRYTYSKYVYFFAILYNFFARYFGVFIFLTAQDNDTLKIIESLVEITRRFIWTLIRVEIEHLNNCDELKSKKSINLTAGELFYRKDHEEAFQNNISFDTETEYEEASSISKHNLISESSDESIFGNNMDHDSTMMDDITDRENVSQTYSSNTDYCKEDNVDQAVINYDTELDTRASSGYDEDAY